MIHPSAIIEKGAELGSNVRVGAMSYVGPDVRLGADCELRNHVTITGDTTVGAGCMFFPNAVIGEAPQDLKYAGEKTKTVIGEDNHFREFVTVHPGTRVGGGVTRIGSHNRFLVGVHLAHDMRIGNHVVISNHVQIAGHVHIEDCVTMGGQTGIHQFVTVGRYAMIGGQSHITMDVVPYMITTGYPAEVRGANVPGLRRWEVPEEQIEALNRAFRLLYAKSSNNRGPFNERLEALGREEGRHEHVAELCAFLRRTLSVGRTGRYLESLRQDRPEDSRSFFQKKQGTAPVTADSTAPVEGGDK